MSTIVAKANRAAYLANVLSIAKVGGKVASTESLVLRSIIHRIGGTQDDVAAAGKLLGDGHYRVQLPDSLNERMDNLQDMIMVAIADGNLSPMESKPIERMAKAMHYAQADVDLALRRAEMALRRIGKKPRSVTTKPEPPPLPKKPSKRPARAASQQPPPVPKPEAPAAKPKAPAEVVAEVSKKAPSPEPSPMSDSVSEPEPKPSQEVPPAAVAPPPEKTNAPEMAGTPNAVKACMNCRAESENPETYCFGVPDGPLNPWGCRLSNMPWEPGAPWMELGSFRDDATFVFDKHAIAERLTSQLAAALSCPHLDTEYTEAAFDSLPQRVTIGPRWEYRLADSGSDDAVRVETTEYIHGCGVSTPLTVDGVDPIGSRDAMRIIQKAGRSL